MKLAGLSLWGPGDKTQRRLKVQKPATNKEEEEEETDASNYVLSASPNQNGKPVAFVSGTLKLNMKAPQFG